MERNKEVAFYSTLRYGSKNFYVFRVNRHYLQYKNKKNLEGNERGYNVCNKCQKIEQKFELHVLTDFLVLFSV
ncbi:hypothetical protein BpHYR1_041694 [Brachionus plicatilis]|uniref:Uncharacterized protein n=1 Tax=Brachionus plicatilis TaxID=10195 RepID=A0A3M7Q1I5_BRAPC|nr:hypothetical protein BpHYR1_041694 [Brachionus plicatilis]